MKRDKSPLDRHDSNWHYPLQRGSVTSWDQVGRTRRSGPEVEHESGAIFHRPADVTVSAAPGLCESCGKLINPLTFECRC